MEQYSELLTSLEYVDFILENADYAQLIGYNLNTLAGVREAVADQFLFTEFLAETTV